MPRAKTEGTTRLYDQLNLMSWRLGERNDCAVRAISIACKVPYTKVHEMLAARGRKTGKGTFRYDTMAVINQLGYHAKYIYADDMLATYPNGGKGYKNITSHHPERLPGVWKNGKTYLFFTKGHALAVVDGLNHDWSKGKSLRVTSIVEIVKA